jgi:DNA-binding HxlR family transcriptional regulator/DNA-binding NarL/FixJ family response regulator
LYQRSFISAYANNNIVDLGWPSESDSNKKRYLSEAIDLISKKWHAGIIQAISTTGPMGFSDLQSELDSISAKVLTDALEELQANGLLHRKEISEHPLRVEYSLTMKGKELQTAVQPLADWSQQYLTKEVQPPTVLIADDSQRVADMYAEWLNPEHDVRVAYTGEGAVQAYDDEVDLVVLDCQMPGVHGDRLVNSIRDSKFNSSVIISSPHPLDTDVLNLEFDEYLTKPAQQSKTLDVVDSVLNRQTYDAPVPEYLALQSKQELLQADRLSEYYEQTGEIDQLLSRIEKLEAEIDELPDDIPCPTAMGEAA